MKRKNAKNNPRLYTASERGELEIVKFLVVQGENIHEQNEEGETAFHAACKNGHLEIVRYFNEHRQQQQENELGKNWFSKISIFAGKQLPLSEDWIIGFTLAAGCNHANVVSYLLQCLQFSTITLAIENVVGPLKNALLLLCTSDSYHEINNACLIAKAILQHYLTTDPEEKIMIELMTRVLKEGPEDGLQKIREIFVEMIADYKAEISKERLYREIVTNFAQASIKLRLFEELFSLVDHYIANQHSDAALCTLSAIATKDDFDEHSEYALQFIINMIQQMLLVAGSKPTFMKRELYRAEKWISACDAIIDFRPDGNMNVKHVEKEKEREVARERNIPEVALDDIVQRIIKSTLVTHKEEDLFLRIISTYQAFCEKFGLPKCLYFLAQQCLQQEKFEEAYSIYKAITENRLMTAFDRSYACVVIADLILQGVIFVDGEDEVTSLLMPVEPFKIPSPILLTRGQQALIWGQRGYNFDENSSVEDIIECARKLIAENEVIPEPLSDTTSEAKTESAVTAVGATNGGLHAAQNTSNYAGLSNFGFLAGWLRGAAPAKEPEVKPQPGRGLQN